MRKMIIITSFEIMFKSHKGEKETFSHYSSFGYSIQENISGPVNLSYNFFCTFNDATGQSSCVLLFA